MENENNDQPKQSGGYGKKSKGKLILIYVVVGIIVYGLVYYLFFRGNSGY